MDSDEKAFAITERNKALLSKCYEAALVKSHLESYLALTRVDSAIQDLLSCPENMWKEGISPAPLQLSQYKDWHKVKEYTQELLHSDDAGWVPPQLDFEKVQARHNELFQLLFRENQKSCQKRKQRSSGFILASQMRENRDYSCITEESTRLLEQ
ncbi:hypothetical protein BDDG_12200 [Blastomyces dermatitidis ATCC 18188]|uniref:Uncharacterized protein n=1 Tax=Ajellomyces dermatitidis (strain ATCC 18188 / CBS 674.68) TaxID=653446 RepID=A0A0J9HEY6_AJEDA|nr:hypothetical protein BDFG_06223 [Blastomyces dermatitidis ATCC 26199]KMW67589.1 hypothetical protein BDDG_12200 [Blastomyces dermatitidis ATCC 18188]